MQVYNILFKNNTYIAKKTMIQRIQTLYILIATLLVIGSVLFVPYGADSAQLDNRLLADELFGIIWLILFCTFSLISIFKFKSRKQQLYYIHGNLMGIIALVLIIYLFQLFYAPCIYLINWLFTVSLSLAGIFLLLAKKAIKADDDLINSINRLR